MFRAHLGFGCSSTAWTNCNTWSNWLPWTPSEILDNSILETRRRFCRRDQCLVEQKQQREVNRSHLC